mmetsp:Transcript_2156/g.4640  ORF Transcript_2156/g.4640 Transcript_2156/m.4640 type:complete len:264 (+) Transcript_2156:190-981(+)
MKLQLLSFLTFSAVFDFFSVSAGTVRGESTSSAVIQIKYDVRQIENKAVFLKFSEAGCVACKDSAAVWEELAKQFSNNKDIVIAEIECNDENYLCEENEILSYPTFKYGDVDMLRGPYKGPMDFESLKKFTLENVRLTCTMHANHWCNDEELALIESLRKMPLDELLENIDDMESAEEEEFEAVENKLEAAKMLLEAAEKNLKKAEKGSDNTEIEFAKTEVISAKKTIEDLEVEFDILMDKEDPFELTLMGELMDELELEMES